MRLIAAILCFAALSPAATKYSGPRPPKADVLYLLHADNLVETSHAMATDETRKDAQIAILQGAASTAKTPLAEPVFLIRTQKLAVDKLAAFKMEVKNGNREVVVSHKKPKNAAKPIPLVATRVDEGLYRVEVDEPLEPGEYTISPEGANDTWSFQVY